MDQATLLKLMQAMNALLEVVPLIKAYAASVQATEAADLSTDEALTAQIQATMAEQDRLLAELQK